MKKTVAERIFDSAQIPREYLPGTSEIKVVGNRELQVEGYRGLIEYTDKMIRLDAKRIYIAISGYSLVITRISEGSVGIMGEIENISFEIKNKKNRAVN